jgi:Cdc6-like AAA superfamily ATPase
LDFPVQQSVLISRIQEGTGEWFFESNEFKTWLNGTRETLFCPGIPGAGKTMLASIVVDYLSNAIRAEDVGIAYMYCTYRNRLEQTPIRLLASLLKQLLQELRFIPEGLKNLYEYHIAKNTFPTLDEVSKILNSEMARYSKVFIVIDALDECADDDGAREILLSEVNALQTTNPMNLMVTSRPILKIEQKFQKAMQLEIRASDADVQKYLEGQMSRLASCVTRNISLQETIKSEIVKAVDGMYVSLTRIIEYDSSLTFEPGFFLPSFTWTR